MVLPFIASIALLGPPAAGTPTDYAEAVAELQWVIDTFAAEDRLTMISTLEQLLTRLAEHPDEVRSDHGVSSTLLRGRVILAGLYLATNDESAAARAMDEAIRSARDQALPVRDYGPSIVELYERRKAELDAAGMATIDVRCARACKVVINERLVFGTRERLPLGDYRVWVKALEGDVAWEFHTVELDRRDTVVTVDYEPPPLEPVIVEPPRKRMLPRGVEVGGVVIGVGLAVAGAVLFGLDGKCKGDLSSSDASCDNYDTQAAGIALLGSGGGLFAFVTPLLIVDEVRVGKQRGRSVMIGLSWKF